MTPLVPVDSQTAKQPHVEEVATSIKMKAGKKSAPAEEVYRQLTAEEVKARGPRNLAIAGLLIFLVVLFFFVTLIRLGGNVADRSL